MEAAAKIHCKSMQLEEWRDTDAIREFVQNAIDSHTQLNILKPPVTLWRDDYLYVANVIKDFTPEYFGVYGTKRTASPLDSCFIGTFGYGLPQTICKLLYTYDITPTFIIYTPYSSTAYNIEEIIPYLKDGFLYYKHLEQETVNIDHIPKTHKLLINYLSNNKPQKILIVKTELPYKTYKEFVQNHIVPNLIHDANNLKSNIEVLYSIPVTNPNTLYEIKSTYKRRPIKCENLYYRILKTETPSIFVRGIYISDIQSQTGKQAVYSYDLPYLPLDVGRHNIYKHHTITVHSELSILYNSITKEIPHKIIEKIIQSIEEYGENVLEFEIDPSYELREYIIKDILKKKYSPEIYFKYSTYDKEVKESQINSVKYLLPHREPLPENIVTSRFTYFPVNDLYPHADQLTKQNLEGVIKIVDIKISPATVLYTIHLVISKMIKRKYNSDKDLPEVYFINEKGKNMLSKVSELFKGSLHGLQQNDYILYVILPSTTPEKFILACIEENLHYYTGRTDSTSFKHLVSETFADFVTHLCGKSYNQLFGYNRRTITSSIKKLLRYNYPKNIHEKLIQKQVI